MAGNSPRWTMPRIHTRRLARHAPALRVDQLEDRTAPAIIQVGLPTWLEAGPSPAENGQVTGIPGPPANPVTGAVEAVATHPTDPNILFVGTVNGGVWRTFNALSANPDWTPLTDQLPTLSIGTIALNPENPNQLVVGLGAYSSFRGQAGDLVGAYYTDNALDPAPSFRVLQNNIQGQTFRSSIVRNGYTLLGGSGDSLFLRNGPPNGGVFRSLDGGATFANLAGTGGLPAAADVAHMISDPRDPNRVVVATESGIFLTSDIGSPVPTWVDVTSPVMQIGAATGSIKLGIHSTAAGGTVLYVGVVNGGELSTVSWSDNLGATWTAMDLPEILRGPLQITAASNASPIVVTVAALDHGLATGDRVLISGVQGNLEANGVWTVTRTSATTVTLQGSSSTGIYAGGGVIQKIVGIHPGQQGDIHFGLTADPSNPNLVYVSGDRQDFPFPNGIGATNFTASVHLGDRTKVRSGGFTAPTTQWTPLTNDFAANDGGPHADSRGMAIDASGTLLEFDDGGIYRRLAPTSPSGSWVSVNGDLALSQMLSVAQDTVNNIIFAGTQDTGSIQQQSGAAPQGSSLWDTILQGDGWVQAADNSSIPGNAIRYTLGNTVQSFERNQYDDTNTFVSSTPVMLADIATPNKRFSGISGADGGLYAMQYVLNKVDPRLMLLGGALLYEDNDPNPTLGFAGDVIAKVTPAGLTGRIQALSYGGRQNGTDFVRIAHVGTSTGDLFVRGPGNAFFQVAVPGKGGIDDLVVDPDDWQTFYVLRNNQVYMTTDAGTTFTDATSNLIGTTFDANGNLVSGLTTTLTTLALWDPAAGTAAGFEVLLAAGNGGVFRRVPGLVAAGGDWSEYGIGIPNVVVNDLQVYGNSLVAGTNGRGAFEIPDVSDSISQKAQVIVQGNSNSNVMSIQSSKNNPAYVVVDDGAGNTLAVDRSSVQTFTFQGLGGADTIQLLANGFASGDLSFVRFNIEVDGGGDPGDAFVIRDAGRTLPTRATITATSVGNGVADNIFGSNLAQVTYTGLQQGTLLLDLGELRDTSGNVVLVDGSEVYVQSTAAFTTSVIGTPGTDVVRLGSLAGVSDAGDLNGIRGTVTVDGRAPGRDTLVVSDYAATAGNGNAVVFGNTVTGLAGQNDEAPVTFANLLSLIIFGSNAPGLAETMRIQNPAVPEFSLLANDGPDVANVRAASQKVTVNGGAGNDVIRASSFAGDTDDGDLTGLTGTLVADGGPGDNRLILSNFASVNGSTATVTTNTIAGVTPQPITYLSSGGRFFAPGGDGLLLRLSNAGNDFVNLVSTLAGSQTAVDGNGGSDVFTTTAEGLRGDVLLRGSGGADKFTVNSGNIGGLQNSLRLSGGPDSDTAFVAGFVGDETASVTMFDATNGRVGGLGAAIDFDTQEVVTYDGAGGRNNLNVVDASPAGFGSVQDPGSGIVYRPLSETAGNIRFGGGSAGPLVEFRAVNGKDDTGLVITGDPTGQARDVLTVLGVSDDGRASTLGELTASNGADQIFVSDQMVTIRNAANGYLRSVALGRANGGNTFSALVVRTGNEVGEGDQVTVVPSRELNIFLDGQAPTRRTNGDRLTIDTALPQRLQVFDDPNLGPRHTRVILDNGATVGFVNFDNTAGTRSIFAVSADVGGGPRVQVYDTASRALLFDRFVYDPSFTGGVRVATGDVTGDSIPDLVTVAGIGGGPHVQVFDGVTFQSVASFFAYEESYRGGLYVAVGDVTGDGVAEIVTGTGDGGGPLVRVFDGAGRTLSSFFAYDPNFRGGVRVAVSDVTGDGVGDIVTGAGVGGSPLVRVFDGTTVQPVLDYFAFDPNARSGVFVAAGDLDGDSLADIVAGPGGNEETAVQVRQTSTGNVVRLGVFDVGPINSPQALPAVAPNVLSAVGSQSFERGGIRVAVTNFDPNSDRQQIVTGRGSGFAARVHAYNFDPLEEVGNLMAFEGFTGGIFVG